MVNNTYSFSHLASFHSIWVLWFGYFLVTLQNDVFVKHIWQTQYDTIRYHTYLLIKWQYYSIQDMIKVTEIENSKDSYKTPYLTPITKQRDLLVLVLFFLSKSIYTIMTTAEQNVVDVELGWPTNGQCIDIDRSTLFYHNHYDRCSSTLTRISL